MIHAEICFVVVGFFDVGLGTECTCDSILRLRVVEAESAFSFLEHFFM